MHMKMTMDEMNYTVSLKIIITIRFFCQEVMA